MCLETNLVCQSAVPSTSQKEHWPCAVKTHFPRQHRCLGRIYILVIYTHTHIYILLCVIYIPFEVSKANHRFFGRFEASLNPEEFHISQLSQLRISRMFSASHGALWEGRGAFHGASRAGRAAGAADGLQGWHLGRNGCLVDGFINIAVDVIKSSMSRRYETIKQDY